MYVFINNTICLHLVFVFVCVTGTSTSLYTVATCVTSTSLYTVATACFVACECQCMAMDRRDGERGKRDQSRLKILREAIWVLNDFGFEQEETLIKALWKELELRERSR